MSDLSKAIISSEKKHKVHNVYLPFTLECPEELVELFSLLDNCKKGEKINIHINCCGGWALSGIQLYNAIKTCKAKVTTIINCYAASAATFVFLAGHKKIVTPNSQFMIHAISTGTSGKYHEILEKSQHVGLFYKDLFKKIYKGFLTKNEIRRVLKGKDLWMTGEEVNERLNGKK